MRKFALERADRYIIDVDGSLPPLDRAALFVDLGPGLAYNEVDPTGEGGWETPVKNGAQSRRSSTPSPSSSGSL